MPPNIPMPQMYAPSNPLPSHLTRSPSGYTCSHNYKITTSLHINNINTLCGCSQSSMIDSTSSNSLFNNNVRFIDQKMFYLLIFDYEISRVIHFHLIDIHFKQLLLVLNSLDMFNHYH